MADGVQTFARLVTVAGHWQQLPASIYTPAETAILQIPQEDIYSAAGTLKHRADNGVWREQADVSLAQVGGHLSAGA